MNHMNFKTILNGNIDNLPVEKSKTVRIFLSSTLADTHTERDYLIEHVYPKLKTYCKQTYGLDFQILDMRWLISSEITNSHMATTISINEIRTCQKYSVGPNFIALLSNRYGSISLPTRIIKEEYELFESELENYKETWDLGFVFDEQEVKFNVDNLFKYCYELDENEIPARYKLKHLELLIPQYEPKRENIVFIWSKMQSKLSNIMKMLAQKCYDKKLIDKVKYDRYYVSLLEKEIFNGILTAKEVENNVLCFHRNIINIEEDLSSNAKIARKYINLDTSNQIDHSSQLLLDELKNHKIPSKLPSSNIFNFDVKLDKEHGISLETHYDYIKQFSETFYEQVKGLVDLNQTKKVKISSLSPDDQRLLEEVVDHTNFCNESVEKFHGRSDLLDQIKSYLLSDMNSPLILFGESGCGKTAILAKITSEIPKLVDVAQNYTILLRFMGTTPQSSNIESVFTSLISQLCKIFEFNEPEKKALSKTALKDFMLSLLYKLYDKHPEKKVVFVLDSIDQLSSADYNLDWFMSVLPPNTKMILSTLPDHEDILNRLKENPKLNESNFLKIERLNSELATTILSDWLRKSQRSLSENQWELLNRQFGQVVLYPLYVKLIFDIVCRWTSSYEPDEQFNKALTIDKCIEYLFKMLEKKHGEKLFARSLVYMTSFENGISESELEDILSLDDDVLSDIFEFHAPPSRRFPLTLWYRIKHDLKSCLVERQVDDTIVIYWYHRRFVEVTKSTYIMNQYREIMNSVYSNIVDFFLERWRHEPKPFKYNEYMAKKLKLQSLDAQQIRNTSIQPTYYTDKYGIIYYNRRKLAQLPYILTQISSYLAIPLACQHVYFDFHFMTGLFCSFLFSDVFRLFESINCNTSYNLGEETKIAKTELGMMSLVFLQCGYRMKQYPNAAVAQILFRTLKFHGYTKYFTQLIDRYDMESYRFNSLVVTNQCLEAPGNEIIFELDKHDCPITHTAIGGDNDSIVVLLSNKAAFFNMTNVQEIGEIELNTTNTQYSFFLTYTLKSMNDEESNLKNFPGYLVVGTKYELQFYMFDSTHIATIKFDRKVILDVVLIAPGHILVAFENEKHVEVYNILTGELKVRRQFDQVVKMLKCNTFKKLINELNFFENSLIELMVGYESNEMDFYRVEVKYDETSQNSSDNENILAKEKSNIDEISLKRLNSLPSNGSQLVSFDFLRNRYEYNYSSYLITYGDGTILLGKNLADEKIVHWQMNNYQLEIVDFNKTSVLFVNRSNGYLVYFRNVNWEETDESRTTLQTYEIEGFFDDGIIVSEKKIAGIFMGAIHVFLTLDEKKSQNQALEHYHVAKLAQLDAHLKKISFSFTKDDMLLTTSHDKKLRVFYHSQLEKNETFKFKLDKSEKKITNVIALTKEGHVITCLENSTHFDVWNIKEGIISQTFDTSSNALEKIEEMHVIDENYLITLSKCEPSLFIRVYLFKINESKTIDFKLEFESSVVKEDNYRLLKSESKNSEINIYILTEKLDENCIKIYNLKSLSKKNISLQIEVYKPIKLDSVLIDANKSKIENSCLTSLSGYIALVYDQTLFYVDPIKSNILASKKLSQNEIDLNYFLSPTNQSIKSVSQLTPVANSDNFISLSDLNDLIYVDFNNQQHTIKLISSNNNRNKYQGFTLNSSLGYVIALDRVNSQLIAFDLNVVRRSGTSDKAALLFKVDLNVSNHLSIDKFDVDERFEHIYLVQDKKLLKLYSIKQNGKFVKLTGEMPLYCDCIDVTFNDDFVCLAMHDQKVISFLIVDPDNKQESRKKIKNLPSRNVRFSQNQQNKINDMLQVSSGLFEEESSDSEIDEKLLDDEFTSEKKTKTLQLIKLIKKPFLTNSFETVKLNELGTNWLIKYPKKISTESKLKESTDNDKKENDQPINNSELTTDLNQTLVNRKKEIRLVNSGNTVSVSNQNSSQACLLQ